MVGKYLRVKTVNEQGMPELEWVDVDSSNNLDVQINGESIVKDGVAEIPVAKKYGEYGVFRINSSVYSGLEIGMNAGQSNTLYTSLVGKDYINRRVCLNQPLGVNNLDYAVKCAMCDGKGAAWSEEEQASARERIGIGEWEKIAEIVIPDDAEEANALTIKQDINGEPFELVKARLCALFPKYTGETDIPNWSFSMLNDVAYGKNAPLMYTSVYPKLSKSIITGMVWEIDVSGKQQIEKRICSKNLSWESNGFVYGCSYDTPTVILSDRILQKPIKSIGGSQMLIYPGCKFMLYGVRA